jgi:hypothetical protein
VGRRMAGQWARGSAQEESVQRRSSYPSNSSLGLFPYVLRTGC